MKSGSFRIRSGWKRGIDRLKAAILIGEDVRISPLPFGRSGCVTTAMTSSDSASASKEGRANSGVPMKTARSRLGFGADISKGLSLLLHFFEFPEENIFLKTAEAIHHQNPVEMIDLMLKETGEQTFSFETDLFSFAVEPSEQNAISALYLLMISRNGKTSLIGNLLSFHLQDLRVQNNHGSFAGRGFFILNRQIINKKATTISHLRRRQSQTGRGIKRFD